MRHITPEAIRYARNRLARVARFKGFSRNSRGATKTEQMELDWGMVLTPLCFALGMAGGRAGAVPEIPIKPSPGWMAHTILIADARSLEVVFWNARTFHQENARNSEGLGGKFRELLGDLAELPKNQRSE